MKNVLCLMLFSQFTFAAFAADNTCTFQFNVPSHRGNVTIFTESNGTHKAKFEEYDGGFERITISADAYLFNHVENFYSFEIPLPTHWDKTTAALTRLEDFHEAPEFNLQSCKQRCIGHTGLAYQLCQEVCEGKYRDYLEDTRYVFAKANLIFKDGAEFIRQDIDFKVKKSCF